MKKLKTNLISKCRRLRMRGCSLGEISLATGIPKTTIYDHVKDISLTSQQTRDIEIRNRERNKNRVNPRKGKCLPGREIATPKKWSDDLVHAVAHLMFDGRIGSDGCLYYSKDMYQITHMRRLLANLCHITPKVQPRDNGIYGVVFYHVEFADYMRHRRDDVFEYLANGASASSKRVFLKAFFDDEGNVYFKGDKRRVRGYQKSPETLKQIQNLLLSFGIKGKINKAGTYIEITEKKNLKNFSKEINFSPKICLNPRRKNSIWGKAISRRDILRLLLGLYNR